MKKKIRLITAIIFIGTLSLLRGQRYELGLSLGGANIIGDIGKSNYIYPIPQYGKKTPISIGTLFRYNLNERQSLRANLIYNEVNFSDKQASEDYRKKRLKKGNNTIMEASAIFEYNFFDFNDIHRSAFTPYLFTGLAAYTYNKVTYNIYHQSLSQIPQTPTDFLTSESSKKKKEADISIPFGLGIKFKINYNWVLGFEAAAHYTFQNNLDNSAPKDSDFKINIDKRLLNSQYKEAIQKEIEKRNKNIKGKHQTGNTYKSNDWYMIIGANLTYTFGRPPCICF